MTDPTTPTQIVRKPAFRIKSITVSLKVTDKEYGSGTSGYVSLTSYVEDALSRPRTRMT